MYYYVCFIGSARDAFLSVSSSKQIKENIHQYFKSLSNFSCTYFQLEYFKICSVLISNETTVFMSVAVATPSLGQISNPPNLKTYAAQVIIRSLENNLHFAVSCTCSHNFCTPVFKSPIFGNCIVIFVPYLHSFYFYFFCVIVLSTCYSWT